MAEETLVGGDACLRALDLSLPRLPAQMPGELAHLRDRLGGYGFAEARQPATRVDGNATPTRGISVVEQARNWLTNSSASGLAVQEWT